MGSVPEAVHAKKAGGRRPGGRTARVRRAVFDATLDLLASGGYAAMTVEAVAARAGVNKTTVYRNWPTRTALLLAAAEDRSEALISIAQTGDAERDLVTFLQSVAANISSPIGRALVLSTLADPATQQVDRARVAFWAHRFDAARPLIRSALGQRRVTASETDEFVEMLIGPLFLRVFVTGERVDRAYIRHVVSRALAAWR
jgi:AcrR family transcriptional regulator